MTNQEIMKIVGKDLETLAQSHGICIAAVVAASGGEAMTVVINPLAPPPLALLKTTMALEDRVARLVAEDAPEVFEHLVEEAEKAAPGTPLARAGWMKHAGADAAPGAQVD
jgi:hypothetical protein